jgi:hypothetical protein
VKDILLTAQNKGCISGFNPKCTPIRQAHVWKY